MTKISNPNFEKNDFRNVIYALTQSDGIPKSLEVWVISRKYFTYNFLNYIENDFYENVNYACLQKKKQNFHLSDISSL